MNKVYLKSPSTDRMLFKKTGIYILVLTIVLCLLPVRATSRTPNNLTLDEAVLLAIKNCSNIKDVETELILKEIELRQAREAIRDIRRKQSTVRFSLLYNIEFPSKHGLPREISLVMKVPEIENSIVVLNEKLKYEALNTQFKAESAYIETVELMESVSLSETLLENTKSTLERIQRDYRIGKASRDDYEYLKKEVETQTDNLRKEILRYDNAKKKLGEIVGIDVQTGYSFSKDFSFVSLERKDLQGIVSHSVDNDFDLFKASRNRKIAERELQELRNIYNDRWGSKVSILESELSKNSEINYRSFLNKYHRALNNIERPWTGRRRIRLGFFSIRIPREWFQGEYDGIRYFEDEKYALFLSLIERDRARKAEADAEKQLVDMIEDTYLTVKELEIAYDESVKNAQDAKAQYERAKTQNRLGELSFQELESAKNNAIQSENAVFSSLLNYNKTISMFNLYASGAIDKFRSGVSFDRSEFESGDSFRTDDQADTDLSNRPNWYVRLPITDFKFIFGVNIPDSADIDATHFALFTDDGTQIGNKTRLSNTISHLPISFRNSTRMVVKLYMDDIPTHEAEIDGAQLEGELVFKELLEESLSHSEKNIGEWSLNQLDSFFRSSLSVKISDEIAATHYQVIIDETNITSEVIEIDKPFNHLSIIFNNPEIIDIKLYNMDNELFTLDLSKEDGNNILNIK
ncbi:hypothetical protein RBH29_02765 [Herbivorax sp. ANBcel31]|uniref:TolC family protein n=1 Tax=Herbivorax sp. ANBcel31 TaxID=3069754 RepID=UPI0027B08EC7|nr:hypothetical protein [Herbivorax sp. ANBcel31]MDQ2085360.1 hypothetical protein [Herbivorax sp. ANBcel31]